jgi:hypothetical protein
MPYKNRIETIKQSITLLESRINSPNEYDNDTKLDMRRQLLILNSELSKLTKLQWEEEHDRVNFEDDR